MKSYGYIDDVRYASDYIRYHSSQGRGKNRIRMELMQKGVSDADIEKAWIETEALGLIEDSAEAIHKLLEKKHYSPDMDPADRNRIAAFLMRRGYSPEDIFREMKAFT